jgi:hypothetical protein
MSKEEFLRAVADITEDANVAIPLMEAASVCSMRRLRDKPVDSLETQFNEKYEKVFKYTISMVVVMVDGKTVNHEHSFQEPENYTFLCESMPTKKPEGFDSVQVFKETFISEVMKNGLFVKRHWYHPNTIKYIEFGSPIKEALTHLQVE